MKRVTIKEVAKHANVSIATVSRVVNNLGTVTEDNRKKVQKAIKELNYFSNTAASNLKKNSSNVIGIVIPTFTNEFFMKMIKGIEDQFGNSEYVFYIASSDDNPEKEKAILRKLFESNAEAVVLATIGNNEEFIRELLRMRMNIITVDRRIKLNNTVDYIGENNYESAYNLTKNFLKINKKKELVLLGGYEDLSIGYERIAGATKALDEADVEFDYYNGEYNEHLAEQIFKRLQVSYPQGCGIVSLNNTMTTGLIHGIYQSDELKNTELYPIASYGQIDFQDVFSKNIVTSVHQFPYEIGKEAAMLLQGKISGETNALTTKLIENIIYS
ncbi:DNA-binding LacI/PurR family transcriptional regulator [Enterococcus sp. PF1-24]|uniref:LacI family DNA-binding transcriptional regulator n=1 Tax=unclassified Enterococcus TaxID=2608891 RepID=UPI002472E91E|nr:MULTISPECIES: LacI family DNA-binding transcriptional regulator [unclassified Enterococcus]MDH6363862.1 DNA-binding LacI/PurR family transcriptional regulator [Enterococcus sp. PFB1-1]MDH6400952.1 DNA-binding LacI/PurR family transcriptional regulator [Enterococcus sp. PF1-24]